MKLLLKILLVIFTLFVILVAGFVYTFNPNDYKDDLVKLVKDQTGRTLSIPGDISLSLFPWIGLELGKVTISNAKGFPVHDFAKIEHLQVRAKLLPLLKKELEADTMVVEGLVLNLAKNKKGISNWDDLASNNTSSSPETKNVPAEKTTSNPANLLAAFALNGISIKNAQLNWSDEQANQRLKVNNIQLSVGKLRPNSKVPFSTAFHFSDAATDAKLNFDSRIVFTSDVKQFTLHDSTINAQIKLTALPQTLSPIFRSDLMTLDLEKQRFTTNNATLSEGDIKIQTIITATQLFSSPQFNTQAILHTLNPKLLAQRFSVPLPQMSDTKAFTNLGAEITAQGTANHIVLPRIAITLDETKIKGNASNQLVSGHSSLNLNIDSINIDRYLPKPAPASTSGNKTTPSIDSSNATLIPLALLQQFNVDAVLKINQLQIKNTHWKTIHLKAQSKNGLIQLNPVDMHGYNADIKSTFTINAISNTALLSGKVDMQNFYAGQFLKDFMAMDKLKGQASLSATFSTQGLNILDFKKQLKGNIKLNLKDGTLKGFDIEHQQKVLEAKIKQQPVPAAPKNAETKIANLSASATINNGIVSNKDLRAATPLSRVIGQGTVNLVNESLSYVASVKFTNSTDINAETSFEKMNAIPLDVYIKGNFDNLQIQADFQKALNMLLQKELQKHEKKIKDQIQRELERKKQELKQKEQELKEKAQLELKRKEQELKQKEQEAKDKLKQDAQKELDKKEQELKDKLKNLFKF